MIHTLLRPVLGFAIATAATVLIIAGSAGPVAAATAVVAADGTVRTERLDIRGIDRDSTQGQARIAVMIDSAARRVCDNGDYRTLVSIQANHKCVSETLARTPVPRANYSVADAAPPTKSVRR